MDWIMRYIFRCCKIKLQCTFCSFEEKGWINNKDELLRFSRKCSNCGIGTQMAVKG